MKLTSIFKALGDENRLRIIALLFKRELCVCDIESILKMTQSNASRHLTKLKTAGIIEFEKKAQWVFYRIDKDFLKNHSKLIEYLKIELNKNEKCGKDNKILEKHSFLTQDNCNIN